MKKSFKNTMLMGTALGATLMCLVATPAIASESDGVNISALEAQLKKAIEMIEEQSHKMTVLQNEVTALKVNKNYVSMDVVAREMSSVTPAAGVNTAASYELEERVAELEEQILDVDDKVGSETLVNSFDASNLDIGGFINTAFTYVDGEDGSAFGWNRQNFELLIRADLNEQWSAFFAGGFIREGNVSFDDDNDGVLNEAGERRNPDYIIEAGAEGGTKNPQIIAWMNYKHEDALNFKLGRFFAPHGIINIEHFPATLLDQEQPLFLRPFGGQTIFPNFVTGAQVHGELFYGEDALGYNAYVASAQSAIEENIYGGRVEYDFGDEGVTVGLNAAMGTRSEALDNDYILYGADLLIDKGPILWKNEIFATDEDGAESRLGFYTQPAYRFSDKWIGFYKYDYLDDGDNGAVAVPDNDGHVTEHMLGINYLPIPNVRMRLTGTKRHYGATALFDEADANILQFSTTFSF